MSETRGPPEGRYDLDLPVVQVSASKNEKDNRIQSPTSASTSTTTSYPRFAIAMICPSLGCRFPESP